MALPPAASRAEPCRSDVASSVEGTLLGYAVSNPAPSPSEGAAGLKPRQARIVVDVGIVNDRVQRRGCKGEAMCPLGEECHPPDSCPCRGAG